MKKYVYLAIIVMSFVSCKQKTTPVEDPVNSTHNSRNSVEWQGTYIGTIPAADCEGINVQMILEDSTYQLTYQYIGKDDAPYQYLGKFWWNDAGSKITLDIIEVPPYYKVGENRLFQLDMKGNTITGPNADKYVLNKKVQ